MVCTSGFQMLRNLGPQKTQQMSGSPSVFWKKAACTPPNSQVPTGLAASAPTLGTTSPAPLPLPTPPQTAPQ